MTCGPAPVVGQFGPYPDEPALLHLARGAVYPVYRIKYWTFENGQAPALQLEYDPLRPVSDSGLVKYYDVAVWPAFAPYVDSAGVDHAIITATHMVRSGVVFRTVRFNSYGVLAHRDSRGRWKFDGDSVTLPLGDTVRNGIVQPNGVRLPLWWGRREAEEFGASPSRR